MRSQLALLIAVFALGGLGCFPLSVRAENAPIDFAKQVEPVLEKYCIGCHSGRRPKANLSLKFKDGAAALQALQTWEKVQHAIQTREMPPKGKPQPKPGEADFLMRWIGGQLAQVDCNAKRDPGRVTIRRLNRAEYNNTIRDLVGVDFRPADDFPTDDVGYGFDNIGDVLSLPPILLEKYLAAAEKIVEEAFAKPETRWRIMIVEPTAGTKADCARKIIGHFARRAYRRLVKPEEVDRLARFVEIAEKQGDTFETGIRLALQAVLVSPHFLFRVELDKEPNNPEAVWPIGEFELATRLSYFLWSSMPDEELFALAERGELRKNLEPQVRRMLKDRKSQALVENFAGQWLQTRNLRSFTPDKSMFPAFDEALRAAMIRETELFFEAIVKEDRNFLEFLDADFTFLNERLARHYGIPGVQGEQWRRVSLQGTSRGGLLTQASILTVTSNPTRTSPVKRGKWILENILGTPPPPPPPEAGELNEDKAVVLSGSLRKRMEQHRANALCASCHQRMDPLGFGFENFDTIGAWRARDGNFDIDPSGVLPDGKSFKGPIELKKILKGQADLFRRCLAEKLLTYGLGRGLEFYDKCAVDDITKATAKNGDRFVGLIVAVGQSGPFQLRRGKRGGK